VAAAVRICATRATEMQLAFFALLAEREMLARGRTPGEPSMEFVEAEAAPMPREHSAEMLCAGSLDLRVCMDAVDWIWKEDKASIMQQLSVACLSLAAKI